MASDAEHVVHTLSQADLEFEANLAYKLNSRTTRVAEKPCLKTKERVSMCVGGGCQVSS